MSIRARFLATSMAVVVVGTGVLFFLSVNRGDSYYFASMSSVGCFVITTGFALFLGRSFESPEVTESRQRVRDAERGLEEALVGTDSHRDEEPNDRDAGDLRGLALARLWALTHSQLELYHKIATRQATTSFVSAQVAMALGFALLGAFVAVALQASTTTGAIVAGGLGAVSAALAAFISKTFVRSQETAAGHLKSYFDQPLEFSRYLAAERLIADSSMSSEQRAEVIADLAKTIVTGPGVGPATADPAAGADGKTGSSGPPKGNS